MLVLGLHSLLIAQTPQTLIASRTAWKYWANSTAPASNNWKGGGTFDDSAWPSGASPLGYSPGNQDSATTIVPTGCPVPGDVHCGDQKYPTIYFRKTVTISNVNDFQKFIIRYQRDDGIVLYVNGAEIKREFMPDGIITRNTSATAGPANAANETEWVVITSEGDGGAIYPRIFLHTGVNVISAEVHQAGTISTDLRFNLTLEGVPVTTAPVVKIVRGPYLQMGTTTSMTLRWSTEALTRGQVRYDTVATRLTVGNAQVVTETGLSSDHQTKLTNLLPNRKYYYIIEAAGPPVVQLEGTATTASNHYFYTSPLPGTAKKTRIWALGDFGTDNGNAAVNRRDSVITSFKSYLSQKSINYVDLWLWMGDNAYDWGLDEQYQANVFDKGKSRYDWLFRQTPFYATPGNHDYQNNQVHAGLRYQPHPIHYYDIVNNFAEATDGGGGVPSHREEYYSFNYNNIHIVSLDSYGFENQPGQGTAIFDPNGPQVTWLKQDLAAAQSNPAIHWTILYWHHPPYTRGSYNSDTEAELVNVRKNLVPILENYKVDLVMSGHSHVYERSRLMKGLYPTTTSGTDSFSMAVNNPFLAGNAQSSGRSDGSPNSCFYFKNTTSAANEGVIYVVNGAGGRGGGGSFGSGLHPAMQSSINEGGSVYLEIDGKRLDAKFVSASGTVKDQFTIIKDNDGFPIPPTDGTTRTATCQCTDANGFTHYTDPSANLLLSIKKNNYNIGTVGVPPFDLKLLGNAGVKYIDAYSPANYVKLGSYGYRNIVAPWIAFNRYWTLTPGTELSGNNQVIIRQYYKDADMTALNAPYVDDPMGHGNLKLYKINDAAGAYNLNPAAGHTTIRQAGAYNLPGAWIYDARVHGTRGGYPTTHYWLGSEVGKKYGDYPADQYPGNYKGNFYSDYIAGRLKGSGGIGAPSNFLTNPSGQVDLAPQLWFYMVTNTPPSDWKSSTDFTGWTYGRDVGIYVPLGYSPQGEDGEVTRIPNGCPTPNDFNPDCQTKNITTYFKSSGYSGYNGSIFQSYILNYRRNDGVIIYLNGQEVLPRDPNMPAPPVVITPSTLAAVNTNELEWRTVIIPASAFRFGGLVAAEVHQSSPSSPDMHFNIELIGSPDVAETPIGLRAAALVKEEESLMMLYPNPATGGKVFFSSPLHFQTLQLTDLQGKTYRYISQPGIIAEFDVSALPAGMYILSSEGTEATKRFKIVKQ